MKNFRYVQKGHRSYSLTDHEFDELKDDFGLNCYDYYVITPLTKKEWEMVKKQRKIIKIGGKRNGIKRFGWKA